MAHFPLSLEAGLLLEACRETQYIGIPQSLGEAYADDPA